ncbi:hypothetical protein MRX96_003045 [Rhipicephalus microplus]
MPAAPKVAYVVYDDNYRAIVSLKLIKNFKPASVADCQKHKEIYWKSNEAEHADEGYYRGDVILLDATFSDLIQKMGKKRLLVHDTVFYDIDSEEETTEKKHWLAVPVAANNAAQAHLLIMAPINMRPPTGAFKRRVVSNAAFAIAAAFTATRPSVAFFRAATDAAMPIDASGTTPWNYFKWFSRTY